MGSRAGALVVVGVCAVLGVVVGVLVQQPAAPSGEAPSPSPPGEGFASIPKIDVHTHVGPDRVDEALQIMAQEGVAVALNASGGAPGAGLERSVAAADRSGGRLRPYCNLSLRGSGAADFGARTRATLSRCKELGAVGLKIFKSLGLGLRSDDGALLRVDAPELDVVFETAGALGLPVLIHSGDPQAFFRPATEDNERYAELQAHPGWSFYGETPDGRRWPSWQEVFDQYERRVARHPGTTFVGAHFGNAPEEPRRVARMLERYPNLYVETGARVPEIGRHDAEEMRAFFERFADRILFGTDLAVTAGGLTLGSSGAEPDPPEAVHGFFVAHFRYLETNDRRFPHPTPIQGEWTIDGLGLGRDVLERVYYRNAVRLFGLTLP